MILSFNKNYIIGFPPSDIGDLSRLWLSCLGPLVLFLPNYFVFPVFGLLSIPDEGYSRNVPDEGYSRNVPDEGYSRNVPDEGYSRNVPNEGYSRNVPDEGYSRNVPDEGYPRNSTKFDI